VANTNPLSQPYRFVGFDHVGPDGIVRRVSMGIMTESGVYVPHERVLEHCVQVFTHHVADQVRHDLQERESTPHRGKGPSEGSLGAVAAIAHYLLNRGIPKPGSAAELRHYALKNELPNADALTRSLRRKRAPRPRPSRDRRLDRRIVRLSAKVSDPTDRRDRDANMHRVSRF
jgi:hypothetical protein